MRLSDFYNLPEKDKRRFLENLIVSPLPDDRKREFLKSIIQYASQSEIRSMARAKYHELTTRVKHELEKASMRPDHTLSGGSSDEKISTLQRISSERLSQYKEVIIKNLKSEKDSFVIATMISCIGEIGLKNDSEEIISYIDDPDSRIRANTLQALVTLDSERYYEKIVSRINDPSPRVRAAVIDFLKKRGNHKVIEILKNMVYSNELHSLKSAVFVLNKMEGKGAEKLLELALEKIDRMERSSKSENIVSNIKNSSKEIFSRISGFFRQ